MSEGLYDCFMTRAHVIQFIKPTGWGKRRSDWLRHCAISRNVAGSIPVGGIGIFL